MSFWVLFNRLIFFWLELHRLRTVSRIPRKYACVLSQFVCLSFSIVCLFLLYPNRAMLRGNDTAKVVLHYLGLKRATRSCHGTFPYFLEQIIVLFVGKNPRNCVWLLSSLFYLTLDDNMITETCSSLSFIKIHISYKY